MSLPGRRLYRFQSVELDPAQACLRRNGEDLYVRQKSFQALLYLLEQRHRLVSKDELIEHVWDGMAVSDDALVQLIKELRHHLGDDHRQPRFIKTIPKGGYRFIAPVEELFIELPSIVEIERHESVEIEFEEELSETEEREVVHAAGVRHRTEAAEALEKSRNVSIAVRPFRKPLSPWLRTSLIITAATILLGAGLLAVDFGRKHNSGSPAAAVSIPQLPGKKSLAVMFFENQTDSQDLDWMREGLADMLITDMSRSKGLSVLSRRQLFLLLERAGYKPDRALRLDEALEIAHSSKAEVFVLGSFARLNEKIRVEAQVYDARDGHLLASEQFIADRPDQILSQAHLLSLKLVASLGFAPAEQDRKGLVDVMTNNLEAYRYYSLGLEKAQAFHNQEAITLLEKAVELDPQFAMAYARTGYTYSVAWGFAEKGKPYLEKAFKLSERLTEKDKLFIRAWYAIANLDYPGAINVLREIIAAYPLETEAYDMLSRLLMGEEHADEALEVSLQGLVIDPESRDLLNRASDFYSHLGRHDEAIATCQRFVALAPDEPNAYDSLGLRYQWAGRYQEAIAQYKHALAIKPEFELAVIHLGNTYFQQGRYREALEQFQRYVEIAPSNGERARGYASISYLYLKKGELDHSAEASARQMKFPERTVEFPILVALARGDTAPIEQLKKELVAELPYGNRGIRPSLRPTFYVRGNLALKDGHSAEAVEDFKEAVRHQAQIFSLDAYEDCLADAYLKLGQLDEAIQEYERVLRLNPNYPLAHYHLAQAYERQGKKDLARAAYERFLQVWQEADGNLPEVIAARKQLRTSLETF
jgi:tetratricopeptide (TPR) repeat protein